MRFQRNDGGREAAGYQGEAGDCVTRAIAIATELPYQVVYDQINEMAKAERSGRAKGNRRSSARNGVFSKTTRNLLAALGWTWTPTMGIGTGCRVHLREEELPAGRIICKVSKHVVAVIDGVINDTFNPDRGGTRCVYGYYQKAQS